MKKCLDCNKLIDNRANRYKQCAPKDRFRNYKYNINKCIDCGKPLARNHKAYKSKRCKKCNIKFRYKNHKSKKRHCIDCCKELKGHGSPIRCKECANKGKLNPCYVRDDYKCQICDMIEEEHISVLGKLLTLCSQCNSRVNFNRSYWFQYLSEKVEI